MEPIRFTPECYRIGDEPVYLNSGEFHYFRVPKEDWRKRMKLFRETGGNCVATYIPWLIHEPVEGDFRFSSEDGKLDLEEFLQAALEEGLYVIARPGPYQYSELKYGGLPLWLCDDYPQLLARDHGGRILGRGNVSYLHPLFLEKVELWFERVCPIVAKYTVDEGGPVAFAQFDNELSGMHLWWGSLDYNAEGLGIGKEDGWYARFLEKKYGDVDRLNEAYGTEFGSLGRVEPLHPGRDGGLVERRRRQDYFDFYLWSLGEYAAILVERFREHGIGVPVVHNSANPEMNCFFLETKERLGEQFLLGADHYYVLDQAWKQNNPTPQYAIRVFHSLETLRLMGYPPTIFELPGGSLADWPPITAKDALACYMTNLALGMKGHNYYVFTGGPNPKGAGTNSDIYDYGAAIGPTGEIRPLYGAQKEFGKFAEENVWLVGAERLGDCRFAFDLDQARCDEGRIGGGGLSLEPAEAWRSMYIGPLTSAFCASLSPVACDLGGDDWVGDVETPLVVVSADIMAAAKQERIARFLRNGGRALVLPVLPRLDENMMPCTTLSDFLGRPKIEVLDKDAVRVVVGDAVNVFCNQAAYGTTVLPEGGEVVGVDETSGTPLAWKVETEGGGKAIFLGVQWMHAKENQGEMLRGLLDRLNLRQRVRCSNPCVWTSLRSGGERHALFLLNLFTSEMKAEIACRLDGEEWRDLGDKVIPAMSVEVVFM